MRLFTFALLLAIFSASLSSLSTAQTYSVTDLGSFGGSSFPTAINNAGQVTGYSFFAGDELYHAFLYSGGVTRDLGTLGGTLSIGYAMNASGQITGDSYNTGNTALRAFLFSDGVMTNIGSLGGATSTATAINSSGQITGWSFLTGDHAQHAFLYSGGTMKDLGTFGAPLVRDSRSTALGRLPVPHP